MALRKLLLALLYVAVVGGLVSAAYFTRERWKPFVFSSQAAADPHADEHDHEEVPLDRVTLTPQAMANLGLNDKGAIRTLKPQEYWRKLVIPGSITDRPGESDQNVTTRIAGTVVEIKARPGDTVRPGDPLFKLQLAGEFVQSTQTDLAKLTKELTAAITRRDQTKRLVDAGTKPGIELIEEDNGVNRLKTQVQGHRRQLAVFGLSQEQIDRAERGDATTEIEIVAPQMNKITSVLSAGSETLYEFQELLVQLGEQVQAGRTLCLLASHQRLLIEGRAFKSEAVALADAAEKRIPIEVEFADEPTGAWSPAPQLIIHHLSNQVDPIARTFGFFLLLENEARTFERDGMTFFVWRYRPGQRVRIRVPVEKLGDNVFVLPAGAMVREGGEAFVFVQAGNVFRRKPVRVLHEDRNEVVIARDGSVSAAELVVQTPAAAALNRAIKAAAGGGGGHDHDHAH